MHILHLPDDDLRNAFIFHKPRHIVDPRLELAEDIQMQDLLNLCLVCRRFRDLVQPLLFRDVAVVQDTSRSFRLLRLLLENDRLASYARTFYIRILDPLYDLNFSLRRRYEVTKWPTRPYYAPVIMRLHRLQELRLDRIDIDAALYAAICHAATYIPRLSIQHCKEIEDASRQGPVDVVVAAQIEDLEVSEVDNIYKMTFPKLATADSLQRLRIGGNLLESTIELFRPLAPRKLAHLSVFDLDTRSTRELIDLLSLLSGIRVLLVQTYRGGHAEESDDEGENDYRTGAQLGEPFRGWAPPLLSDLEEFTGEAWLCRLLAPNRPVHRVALQSRVQNSVFGMSQSTRPMQVHSGQWRHEIGASVRAMRSLGLSLAVVEYFECGVVQLDQTGLSTMMENAATLLPHLCVLKLTWIYTGPTAEDLETIVPLHLSNLHSLAHLTISRKAFHVGNKPAEYTANLPWQRDLIQGWHAVCPELRAATVTPLANWKLLSHDWEPVITQPELVRRLVRYWSNPDRDDDLLITIVGASAGDHDPPAVVDYGTTIERLFRNDGGVQDESVARLLGVPVDPR